MSISKSRTLPYSLCRESCECYLPHCRCSANVLADNLKVSPLYRQKDSERWNAAVYCYQEMMSNRDQCCTSPPNSPVDLGPFRALSLSGSSLSKTAH
ncbi:unnamed protein product [Anisakis simplex]|uniref:CFEM domain-containing protein n=1 Tax=Anisakis simplex TaxID=6269 RepID=A0A0M3KDE2_ANISI|nr:unnamed protein product [Anisakis simplex]VDK64609.1 unnamed protein product [Anisakis simplex]